MDVQVGNDGDVDLGPLAMVMERTGCGQGLILTADDQQDSDPALAGAGVIETRSLGGFLIEDELTGKSVDIEITDKKVEPYSGNLPPHLL